MGCFFQNVFIGYPGSMCTGFECTLSSSRDGACSSILSLDLHHRNISYQENIGHVVSVQHPCTSRGKPHCSHTECPHHTHRCRSLADLVFCEPLLFVYGGKVSATKFLLWYFGVKLRTQDFCWICCSVWDHRWIQAKPVSSTSVAGNSVTGRTFFAQRLFLTREMGKHILDKCDWRLLALWLTRAQHSNGIVGLGCKSSAVCQHPGVLLNHQKLMEFQCGTLSCSLFTDLKVPMWLESLSDMMNKKLWDLNPAARKKEHGTSALNNSNELCYEPSLT